MAAKFSSAQSHYDREEQRDLNSLKANLQRRKSSQIIFLRNLNNWFKSVLFSLYAPRNAIALDFCSGKSGDLLKFIIAGARHVVAVDVAELSLRDAINRYNERMPKISYQFIHADAFSVDLPAVLDPSIFFDFASCQFALHYAFGAERTVRQALHNVSSRLKPGARFVGTIPDSRVLMHQFRESTEATIGNSACRVTWVGKVKSGSTASSSSSNSDVATPSQWSNDDVYERFAIDKNDPFGYQYIFKLAEAIDEVPEFLIDFNRFAAIAKEYDLVCLDNSNFHEFFHKHCQNPDHFSLLQQMKCFDEDGRISSDAWQIAYLYRVFVFEKQPNPTQHQSMPPQPDLSNPIFQPRPMSEHDILKLLP